MVTPADVWIPVLSALAGALIGSLASIITTLVRWRADARLAIAKLTIEAATQEYSGQREVVLTNESRALLPPFSTYIYYYRQVLDLLERGALTPESLKRVQDELARLCDVLPGPWTRC